MVDEKRLERFCASLANLAENNRKQAAKYREEHDEEMIFFCEGKVGAYVLAHNLLVERFGLDVELLPF